MNHADSVRFPSVESAKAHTSAIAAMFTSNSVCAHMNERKKSKRNVLNVHLHRIPKSNKATWQLWRMESGCKTQQHDDKDHQLNN